MLRLLPCAQRSPVSLDRGDKPDGCTTGSQCGACVTYMNEYICSDSCYRVVLNYYLLSVTDTALSLYLGFLIFKGISIQCINSTGKCSHLNVYTSVYSVYSELKNMSYLK